MANERTVALENRLSGGRDLNTPMTCQRCGSSYFEEIKLYQFTALTYGGSQYKFLSPQGKNILRCICGYIVPPQAGHIAGGSSVRTSAEAFITSVTAAKDYLDGSGMEAVSKIATSPSELESVRAQLLQSIKDLDTQLKNSIEEVKAAIPAPEAKEKKKKANDIG